MNRFMIGITNLCAILLGASVSSAGSIEIKIDGVKNDEGTVRVALFESEADFKADQPTAQQKTLAKEGGVTIRLEDVPNGRYCIASFQDLNNNEKIDTNFVGVPKEPYGFSRNARGRFGPPAFDDMAFDVGEGTKKMEIRLE
jgi:uncharacterized protein (DUF2141 family)